MPSICTLTGGAWQDTHGNVVANGTLILTLCQDAVVASSNQVAPTLVTFPLDSSGNLQSGATVYANTALSPSGTFYTAEVLNSGGSRVWGPEKWSLSVGTTNASTIVPALANAQIVSPLTIETNGTNNASQVLLNFQDTASVTWSNPSGGNVRATVNTPSFVGYPFSGFPRVVFVISDGVGNPTQYGHTNAPGVLGTAANTAPTATETGAKSYTSAASASTNITAMVQQGFGVSNGFYTYGSSFRFTTRLKLNNTTNARYWFGGVTDLPPGSGSAAYATDTPNTNYCMFRYSAGVDTTIKAVCGTDNTHQTVVDTGVAVDTTASHLFDVQFGVGSAIFTIDGTTSTIISSNVPAAGTTFGNVAFISDNKNTATAVGATFYWMTLLEK